MPVDLGAQHALPARRCAEALGFVLLVRLSPAIFVRVELTQVCRWRELLVAAPISSSSRPRERLDTFTSYLVNNVTVNI